MLPSIRSPWTAALASAALLAGCAPCGTLYYADGHAAVIVAHPGGERFVAALAGVDPEELHEAVGDEDDWFDTFNLEGVYLR
jgi:hypothetical protein